MIIDALVSLVVGLFFIALELTLFIVEFFIFLFLLFTGRKEEAKERVSLKERLKKRKEAKPL